MAQIFSALPGMRGLMAYWYHFAIMFEALFILTTIDAGTRVGALPAAGVRRAGLHAVRATELAAGRDRLDGARGRCAWGYFIWTGSISTIWPMFGIANQLLASVALAVARRSSSTSGRARYAWVTLVPLAFLGHQHADGGFLNVRDNFWPMAIGANAARQHRGLRPDDLHRRS